MDRLTHPTPSHTHELSTAGDQGLTHQYDALGRRVARTASGSTTVFVQVDQQTICDYASGAAPASSTYRYLYGSYIDEPIVRIATSNSETTWYHRNQQYSIVACTDSTGATTERYAYTAYGLPTITDASGTVRTSSAIGNRYTYTGREWDGVLGLYHYRARMYDATVGRFCSRDPIGYLGSFGNLGEYASSGPLSWNDPLGMEIIKPDESNSKCAQCCCCPGNITIDYSVVVPNKGANVNIVAEVKYTITLNFNKVDMTKGMPKVANIFCSLEFWELAFETIPKSRPKISGGQLGKGMKDGVWTDQVVNHPDSPTFNNWKNLKHPAFGEDCAKGNPITVVLIDNPKIQNGKVGSFIFMYSFIRVTGGPACKCKPAKVHKFFHGYLTAGGWEAPPTSKDARPPLEPKLPIEL